MTASVFISVLLTFGYFRVVSSRCGIEKKEKEREHKPEGTRGCTRPEVFGKDAMKKGDRNHPNSMQHGNYRIEKSKISENITKAQVQSGATAHQAMQPSRAERLHVLYDSCAQDTNYNQPILTNLMLQISNYNLSATLSKRI